MSARRSLPELLAAAEGIRIGGELHDPWLSGLRLAGIGWATVELERGAEELFEALKEAGMPEPNWAPASRDAVLGGSAWVAGGDDGRPAIVLLEPDTEGRLAATLARFGEGVAAVYLEATGDGVVEPARVGRSSAGPLGRSRIILARPAWGPHVIVMERTAPSPPG